MRKTYKRIVCLLLVIATIYSMPPIYTFAASNMEKNTNLLGLFGESGGYFESNVQTVERLMIEHKFTAAQGHGFSAERGNNLVDRLKGVNASVVGDNNVLNGPDRKIINRDGSITWIQDKYYQTATKSVEAAFDSTSKLYKYLNSDGSPMQLEVPANQYDEAIKIMQKKIEDGLVPGINDPTEAQNLVRKGNLTYNQAVNIAKAGTVDSILYDSVNGAVVATCAAGISFAVDYVVCMLNGQNTATSLKNATRESLKTGGVAFATYVISSQIAKSGVAKAFVPTAEAIAKSLGPGVSKAILNTFGVETAQLTASQITQKVANVLSKEMITAVVMIAVLTTADVVELFRGRISKEQLLKNLTIAIVSVAAGTAGGIAGGALGSLIAPGAGTAVGSILGSIVAGGAAGLIADWGLSKLYEGDANKMFDIISEEFENLADDYMATQAEADAVVEALKEKLQGDILKDMHASEDREQFARDLISPLFEEQFEKRAQITMPSEYEMRLEMLSAYDGLVFIH